MGDEAAVDTHRASNSLTRPQCPLREFPSNEIWRGFGVFVGFA